MKKSFNKSIFMILCMAFIIMIFSYQGVQARTIVDKKTNKKYELVESREKLIETFKQHVFDLDTNFKIYVSSEVVADFPKEFPGIWKEIAKDNRFVEIWKYNTKYKSQFKNYSKTKAKCWEWDVPKMEYSISKEIAKEIANDKSVVITTMDELVNVYVENVKSMNEFFSLKISKKVIKNFAKDYKKLHDRLNKNFAYREISKYISKVNSAPYDYKNYWKLNIITHYDLSRETADEIIKKGDTYIKSYKELVDEFSRKVKRLDKKIILKVGRKVINLNDKDAYANLWYDLYLQPEFSDVFSYKNKFEQKVVKQNKYVEWIIDIDYDISKREVKALDQYIENTVKSVISSDMKEEQKVEALNNFMTGKHHISYGEKGKEWFLNGGNGQKAKLGKYKVNTSYALYYKKGGTSDAFANLFYRLAKKAGLQVEVISGNLGEMRFSWNMVNLNGKWYHISTVHDMEKHAGKNIDKKYHYLKSDATMEKTYQWDKEKYHHAKNNF